MWILWLCILKCDMIVSAFLTESLCVQEACSVRMIKRHLGCRYLSQMCPGFLSSPGHSQRARGRVLSSLLGPASQGSLEGKQALRGRLQSLSYSSYLTNSQQGILLLRTLQLHSLNPHRNCSVGIITTPFIDEELRHREVKEFSQSHTAHNPGFKFRQSNSSIQTPEHHAMLLLLWPFLMVGIEKPLLLKDYRQPSIPPSFRFFTEYQCLLSLYSCAQGAYQLSRLAHPIKARRRTGQTMI